VYLDGLIAEQVAQPLLRPHMLFLTGDQIYADDVADSVLAMLEDVGRTLGFPNETIPEYNGYPLAHTREPKLEAAGLTGGRTFVDDGTIKSHLITLAEYCAMYLFAFSDVFWQADQPSYFDTFRKNPPVPTGRTPTYDVTKYQFDQENKSYANFQRISKDSTTPGVAPNLLAIRKALANIPTYMIFDDHEITDDWLLDRAWVNQIAGNTLARRVIQNGLSAYALFQAWGNDPAEFQTPSGQQPLVRGEALLHAIRDWAASNTDVNATNLQNCLGLPTGQMAPGDAVYPQSSKAVRWYYRVSFPSFHVVVLDTRTQRAYAGKHDHPALLSGAAMQLQTAVSGLTEEQVLLVISPAPFVGNPDIEGLQTIPRKAFAAPYLLDAEFWIGHQLAFQQFLARLVNLTGAAAKTRIVMLSGDVHYAYTARVRYSAQTPLDGSSPAPRDAVIAQLTCSAFKNEGFPGTKLHVDGVIVHPSSPNTRSFPPPPPDPTIGLPDVISYCWNNPSKQSRTIGTRVLAGPPRNITGNVRVGSGRHPIVYEREYGVTLTAVPDWRIRTRFIRSEEPLPRPNQPTPVPDSPADNDLKLRARLRTAGNHVLYQRYKSAGANAVGLNNLGEVTFQWGTGETKTVVHRLFWRLDGENVGALGRFRVSMALTPENF
jgi:hypothetical protein